MLNKKIPRRLKCKGSLFKYILNGIPVLSIFALIGMVLLCFGFINLTVGDDVALAAEERAATVTPTASLIVNDGNIKDTIIASDQQLAYATHNVNVSATNIKTYSLTISGPTNLTADGSSTVITGASGNTPDQMQNSWGYAWIDSDADPNNASYNSLTPAGTSLTGLTIDSDYNLSGNKQLVFGVKFAEDAEEGTYAAKVNLSLVATPRILTNYSITYNCNSGTGCPNNYSNTSDSESINYTIPTSEPTRSGYKFLGYSTSNTTVADGNYAPGKIITLTTTSPNRTLYAIWQSTASWNSITTMQQMTPEICESVAVGTSKTLTDSRDSRSYTVAKLDDNKCWMTQNLALDLSVAGIAKAAESDNLTTNYPSAALTNYTNSWGGSSTVAAFSKGPTKIYGNGGAYQSSYGYYYNWCAATAGCKDANGNVPGANTDAASSICPKGWQLPKGGSGGDFAGLTNKSASSGGINFGGAFWPYVGAFNGAGLIDAGAVGYYWSRTASSTGSAYHLSISSGPTVNTSRTYATTDGYAVRCVAK